MSGKMAVLIGFIKMLLSWEDSLPTQPCIYERQSHARRALP